MFGLNGLEVYLCVTIFVMSLGKGCDESDLSTKYGVVLIWIIISDAEHVDTVGE